MKRNLSLAVLAGASLLSLATGLANAGTVFSEDFSSGTLGTNIVPGWTLSPVFPDIGVFDSAIYREYAGGTGDTGTGNFVGFGAGNSPDDGVATSPSIALVAGKKYTLSFDYGSYSLDPTLTQAIEVYINATPIGIVVTAGSTSNLTDVLSPISLNFFASSSSVTLSFADVSASSYAVDGLLDNVQVSTTAPELSTWAMLGLGFAALGFVALRKGREARALV